MLNGKRSGVGSMHFSGNDVVYIGEWLDSKRHGQGKLIFDKDEKCFYEGVHIQHTCLFLFFMHSLPCTQEWVMLLSRQAS